MNDRPMTANTEPRRGSKERYVSAFLYFAPICLPVAVMGTGLYYFAVGEVPVLWLLLTAVAGLVWVVVSIEDAEF